tara:strand:+ start:423 stop:578 length:156 start_codon:yes stop_codon:yes gene_type:complete
MVEYDSHMHLWFFWDEAGLRQGFWDTKEDAESALYAYCRDELEMKMLDEQL